ncbi:hypothetical protein GCM10011332_32270 [Terasakiella brassicae]|uniref:Uncharacterized protein n=1 Tax=Terasakiella brassicae TaxID=1634917 RepID=A0A917C973_9PROT|nr:hypothetical protein [Terasakiella brassicae]GGF75813.1 hypothetical protein GCM10011332_32270 [Terasakiella brassicae]
MARPPIQRQLVNSPQAVLTKEQAIEFLQYLQGLNVEDVSYFQACEIYKKYTTVICELIDESERDRYDSYLTLCKRVVPENERQYEAFKSTASNVFRQLQDTSQHLISLILNSTPDLQTVPDVSPETEQERISALEMRVVELEEQINTLNQIISDKNEEIKKLTGQDDLNPADFVDRDKDPEIFELLSHLIELDESARQDELKKVFSKIPVFDGVQKSGMSGLEFLEKKWGIWVKIGWAIKADVRRYSGAVLIRQIDREIKKKKLVSESVLPSRQTISEKGISSLTDDQIRHARAKAMREYRQRKQG